MENSFLKAALLYCKLGFSVIPIIPGQKKPLIPWERYQNEKADEAQIKKWWSFTKNANVGIVTGKVSDIAVIDIDTEQGYEEIQKYVPDTLICPTVATPRGGQHLYFKYPANSDLHNNAGVVTGCDLRAEGGYVIAPPSVNGNKKAYAWLNDLALNQVSMPVLPDNYLAYINNNILCNNILFSKNHASNSELFRQGTRDNDLFHTANCLIKGGMRQDAAEQVLNILAANCNPPFPKGDVTDKVQSAINRANNREKNISSDLREWVAVTNGYFSVTDCYMALQAVTSKQKTAIRVALNRMWKQEGIIEKHGSKDGCYRLVNSECDEIDFKNAKGKPLRFQYPFEIQSLCHTMPKNIIIIAGEPNAGKTAFLLETVRLNMGIHKIHYFSSEMGDLELRDRLMKFDMPLDDWNVNFKERAGDFQDVIQPNDVNIIDFLEVYDEFYKMGLYIKQIFDKLEKGIAIIAIQKNKGSDYGLGGMRGLEKARLYLSMYPGKLRIVKGKNWVGFDNPNGLEIDFKLSKGCKFFPTNQWHKAEI